jgi:hypothetical protein
MPASALPDIAPPRHQPHLGDQCLFRHEPIAVALPAEDRLETTIRVGHRQARLFVCRYDIEPDAFDIGIRWNPSRPRRQLPEAEQIAYVRGIDEFGRELVRQLGVDIYVEEPVRYSCIRVSVQ